VREPDEARCWEAVERTTCAVCLDRDDGGQCHVPGRGADCPLRSFFTVAIDVVRRVHSDAMGPYVAALESDVCGSCGERGSGGECARRDRGECALYAYLPLTVDAIEEALPA
jgi:hypothetical protein